MTEPEKGENLCASNYRIRRANDSTTINYDEDGWIVSQLTPDEAINGESLNDLEDDLAFVQTEALAELLVKAIVAVKSNVVLVEVTIADTAVYLDGNCVYREDVYDRDYRNFYFTAKQIAEQLAAALHVDLDRRQYPYGHRCWTYDDVKNWVRDSTVSPPALSPDDQDEEDKCP